MTTLLWQQQHCHPFYRKRTTFYVFICTAWVSSLSYTLFHCNLCTNTFCLAPCLLFVFFFFWEKLLKSSLDASTWAGRGSSVELVLHTLLKSSPFLPWNLNRAARPALSHTCSWLHGHNTTAQERARRSRFLERGARLPVCLSVKCVNSHWSPELQQKANLLAPAIS